MNWLKDKDDKFIIIFFIFILITIAYAVWSFFQPISLTEDDAGNPIYNESPDDNIYAP